MATSQQARAAIAKRFGSKQDRLDSWPAYLGNEDGTVTGSRAGFVYVRYPSVDSAAVEVENGGVPEVAGLRVMVGYRPERPGIVQALGVADVRTSLTINPIYGTLKNHATQHAWTGSDPVYIAAHQITNLGVYPSSGLIVTIYQGNIQRGASLVEVPQQTLDLTASVPATAGQGRFTLITLDEAGAVDTTDGTIIADYTQLDRGDIPATPAGHFRLAAVRLYGGQTSIADRATYTDIFDLRWPQETISGFLDVSLVEPGSAQYQYLVTGATPFTPAWSAGLLNITSAKTLTVSNTLTLAGTDTSALTLTTSLTNQGAAGVLNWGGAYTLTVPATGTAALLSVANTFTVGPQTIQTGADANKGLIVKANSATQSANLQEWQNSSGTALTSINAEGQISQSITKTSVVSGDYAGLTFSVRGQPGAAAGSEVLLGTTGIARVNSSFAFAQAIGNRATVINESSGNISIASAFHGYWNPQGAGGAASAYGFRSQAVLSGNYTGTTTTFANFVADTVTKFGTPSGTFTSVYGMLMNDFVSNTAATNAYGLYINAISGAATINSAIKTLGGTVQFTHNADSQLLTVTGHTTLSIATALAGITRNDTAAGISAMLGLTALGSGANGDGGSILLSGKSSTTAAQSMGSLKYSWVDATHASRKAKIQISTYDTAERIGLAIEADGAAQDVYFEGGAGSGLPYGSCWGNEIGWSQASAAQDTWYIISDADMADGHGGLNLVTHDGSGKLTVTKAGRYRVNYGISLECSIVNKHVQSGIAVNGTVINDGIQHYDVLSPNAQLSQSSTAIVVLAASGYVEIAVRTTDTGTPDLSVDHLNITIVQIGG